MKFSKANMDSLRRAIISSCVNMTRLGSSLNCAADNLEAVICEFRDAAGSALETELYMHEVFDYIERFMDKQVNTKKRRRVGNYRSYRPASHNK